MRRNVLNLSRFLMSSFLSRNEIKKDVLSQCLGRCGMSYIPDQSETNKIQFRTARQYSKTQLTDCWNCKEPMNNNTGSKESFFCSSCGSLQEVNSNYVREWIWSKMSFKLYSEPFTELLLAVRYHWAISSQSKWAD